MTEKLVFSDAMEGLIKAVSTDISPRCKARLVALGFDPNGKVKPAYPAEQWAGVVKVLGEEIYPNLEASERHRQLALRTMEMFAHSMIGAAMFAVVKLLGPDRTVRRMTRNFRTSTNYIETTCTEVAPHTYDLAFNDVSDVPGFYLGLLEEGFTRAGAKGLSVKVHSRIELGAVYRAMWSA
jgi:uncharacterized protein (TIGR02265 family)